MVLTTADLGHHDDDRHVEVVALRMSAAVTPLVIRAALSTRGACIRIETVSHAFRTLLWYGLFGVPRWLDMRLRRHVRSYLSMYAARTYYDHNALRVAV